MRIYRSDGLIPVGLSYRTFLTGTQAVRDPEVKEIVVDLFTVGGWRMVSDTEAQKKKTKGL